jgi:hypothetical protein
MQYLAAARVMVLITIAACVPDARDAYRADVDRRLQAPTAGRQVAAVGPLAPHPWKVGQWATYRTPAPGYETMSVVALEACGTWLSDDIHTYEGRKRWLICLRTPAEGETARPVDLVQLVIEERDNVPTPTQDFRSRSVADIERVRESPTFAAMIARLMPATWAGDTSLRETIDVPAGRFEMAVRSGEVIQGTPITRWSHPEVPFDGTVEIRDANLRSYALMAYGETGASSVIRALGNRLVHAQAAPARPYVSLGLGVAPAWVTGAGAEHSSGGGGYALRIAAPLGPSFDVVSTLEQIDLDHYTPDRTMNQAIYLSTLGVRWRPFSDASSRLLAGSFVHLDLGYAYVMRGLGNDLSDVASGFAAGAGLGVMVHQTQDIVFGFELVDQVSFFDNGEGTRHSLAAQLFIDLDLPIPITW